MKTLKLILAIALLFLPVFAFSANDEQASPVILKGTNPSEDGNRSGGSVPIECFLYASQGNVSLVSDAIVSSATVELENISTGTTTNSLVQISATKCIIPIHTSGSYVIRISLSDGRTYYGEFYY